MFIYFIFSLTLCSSRSVHITRRGIRHSVFLLLRQLPQRSQPAVSLDPEQQSRLQEVPADSSRDGTRVASGILHPEAGPENSQVPSHTGRNCQTLQQLRPSKYSVSCYFDKTLLFQSVSFVNIICKRLETNNIAVPLRLMQIF